MKLLLIFDPKNRLMRGFFDYTAQLTLGLVCSIHVVEELPEFYRAVGRSENLYSKKAQNFALLLSYVVPVKSKMKISQNFVAFSEYMNF